MPGAMPFGMAPPSAGLPRWLLPVGIGLVVLVIAGIVGVSIGKSIGRPKVAGGGAANGGTTSGSGLGGLAGLFDDSPDDVAEDLKEQAVALRDTLQAINDERSRDAAIPKLLAIAAELKQLALRAGRLEPLSEAEHAAFVQRLGEPPDSEQFDAQRGAQLRQRGILNEELSLVAIDAGSALAFVANVLTDGLKPLPPSASEAEAVEREKVDLNRGAARTLCRVTSAGDRDAAAEELERAIAALRQLAPRKQAVAGVGLQAQVPRTKYLEADMLAARLLSTAAEALVAAHGAHPRLDQAVVDLRSASSHVDFIQGGSVGQAAPSGGPGPGGPGFSPFGPGGPGRPGGPGGPGFDPIAQFVQQYGASKVVTIVCPRVDDDVRDDWMRQLQEIARTGNFSSVSNSEGTRIALSYEGDVEALSRRIDFATVTAVDAASRTIALSPGN